MGSEPSTTPSRPERRAVPRTRVDRPVQLRLVDDQEAGPVDALLIDVSASGVGLRLTEPLAPGREFVLALPNATAVSTPLQYRVVRCKPLGRGEFQVGAAFIRTPRRAVADGSPAAGDAEDHKAAGLPPA